MPPGGAWYGPLQVIRRSSSGDHAWIQQTAATVYRPFGDYGSIIPAWLEHPGVIAYIEESEEAEPVRRGFILLGFYEMVGAPAGEYVADLLAIAVDPGHQRRGVGKVLLGYAIHVARLAGRHSRVPEIRLTVAETNAAGRRLFSGSGFHVVDENHGAYDGGQRAIRMSLRL
jgi:ribosomal protein S18 acetylase RimI-like enzyme